jgi:triacylglycerol lipase
MRVVLIHGIDDTGSVFRRLEADLRRAGHQTFVPEYHPSDGRISLPAAAEQVVAALGRWNDPPAPLAVIAFSMGGLIARYALQVCGLGAPVRLLYTIATPHQGTQTARLRGGAGVRQMRPQSEFLEKLRATEDRLRGLRLVAAWTPLDLMILPAHNCRWPLAENRAFLVWLHPWLLRSRRVRRDVLATLAESAAARGESGWSPMAPR